MRPPYARVTALGTCLRYPASTTRSALTRGEEREQRIGIGRHRDVRGRDPTRRRTPERTRADPVARDQHDVERAVRATTFAVIEQCAEVAPAAGCEDRDARAVSRTHAALTIRRRRTR